MPRSWNDQLANQCTCHEERTQHSTLGEAESSLLVSVKMQGLKTRNKLKRTPASPKKGREPGLCHSGAIWEPAVSGTGTDELLRRALKVFFCSCIPGHKTAHLWADRGASFDAKVYWKIHISFLVLRVQFMSNIWIKVTSALPVPVNIFFSKCSQKMWATLPLHTVCLDFGLSGWGGRFLKNIWWNPCWKKPTLTLLASRELRQRGALKHRNLILSFGQDKHT